MPTADFHGRQEGPLFLKTDATQSFSLALSTFGSTRLNVTNIDRAHSVLHKPKGVLTRQTYFISQ